MSNAMEKALSEQLKVEDIQRGSKVLLESQDSKNYESKKANYQDIWMDYMLICDRSLVDQSPLNCDFIAHK
jgi:hypothetical protein